MIIGLTGKQQVGKDTLAEYLHNKHHYQKMAFADHLKRVCRGYLGWDGKKDVRGRTLLQQIGIAAREYHPDIWIEQVDFMMRHIELGSEESNSGKSNIQWVISDVRFKNEADWITAKGGIIIRIIRDTGIIDTHISETEMDEYHPDYVIDNNRTMESMFTVMDRIIR